MWFITFTPYVHLTLHSYYLAQSVWRITTLFFPKCLSLLGSPTCSLLPSYCPFCCLLNQSEGPLQKHIFTVYKKIIPQHKPPCAFSLHDLGLSSVHTQDIFHFFDDWSGFQDLMHARKVLNHETTSQQFFPYPSGVLWPIGYLVRVYCQYAQTSHFPNSLSGTCFVYITPVEKQMLSWLFFRYYLFIYLFIYLFTDWLTY